MSDSNRVGLRYIEETTWNSLPGTPTMQALRLTSDSIIPAIDTIISEELRSDRMVSDLIQVSRSNTGGFDFELSGNTFDELFEGALFNSWATGVLKNGIEEHSYSIEKALLDIDEYFLFTGMMVNGLTITLATSSIASGSFDFLGAGADLQQTTNAASVTAATSTEIMNCMGNVASLKEGSSLTTLAGIYVQELSFSIANNLRPVYQIGSDIIGDIAVGKMDITGTLNAYFANDRLYDQFIAGSATAIEFVIQDVAGNIYEVLFPNVKFESESIVAPGQDQDVIETLTWRALRSPSYDAQIQITRVVV
jgi:hypothetical protein